MQSFFLFLIGLAFLGACIWFLHRIQLRRTVENADLTAPLDALDEGRLPELVGTPQQAAPAADNNWLAQIRTLRESGQLEAALSQSKAHFPKTQAFQQAAIILRQQIREGLDHFRPVD